jgi:ribonucleoside-diphosphate reductase subunit M1
MNVIKRNGKTEIFSSIKIHNRTKKLGSRENLKIDYKLLIEKIQEQIFNNIETKRIDELMAEQCAMMSSSHYHYSRLASLIIISNHQKEVSDNYLQSIKNMSKHSDYLSDDYINIVKNNYKIINSFFNYNRDYLIDYFGFKTLERAYLIKINNNICERIQHLWMRVSIQIHGDNMEKVKETYDCLSTKKFIHATPTLFNSGTKNPQLSSCYLLGMEDDSIDGIYNTLKDCANISKWAGGIGLHIHNIRSKGSKIVGTNGYSNGISPMLRVFNSTSRYVDQGGGKRNGSFAIYIEPWHGDIETFLDLKKNHGEEENRARDLFYALWIPDLFMEKVENNDKWYLMCPNQSKGLHDVYGETFNELYNSYVDKKQYIKEINARDLWFKILDSQMETGTPYMLYKDSCNNKSNQKNIGTIKSSNLCCEIVEYSDKNQSAVCNLASISLPSFVKNKTHTFIHDVTIYTIDNCIWCKYLKTLLHDVNVNYKEIIVDDFDKYKSKHNHPTVPLLYEGNNKIGGYNDVYKLFEKYFDYDELYKITGILTVNLNNIIDKNFYPTNKTKFSNLNNRPIGIGVQGLADVFSLMNIPFGSPESKIINTNIFETMYHSTISKSNELAIESGPYKSFHGSPLSNGLFQFDLWNEKPTNRYDWNTLKLNVIKYGVKNSLCIAPMPTASTSQILSNNECFEPFTSNIYTRRTLAGEFIVINKHLMKELCDLNIWNYNIKNELIKHKGSIQNINNIPQFIKNKYKIVWEMSMKTIIDMCKDRAIYICQSQSMNLWIEKPNYSNLTKMHFYAWTNGLKTGLYYLRRKANHQAQQFTVKPDNENNDCIMCGS